MIDLYQYVLVQCDAELTEESGTTTCSMWFEMRHGPHRITTASGRSICKQL